MTTSRTGTALHKRTRQRVLDQARQNGQTNCPLCGTWLNWNHSRHPNSPEPDELDPYAITGHTNPDTNRWRVICRHCNQVLGGHLSAHLKQRTKPKPTRQGMPRIQPSRDWTT